MEQRNFVSFDWPSETQADQEADYDVVPPGRPIMESIRNALIARGINAGPVDQHESYGWYLNSNCGGETVWSMLQYAGPWLVITEPRHSLWKRLLGKTSKEPVVAVCTAIHEHLSNTSEATLIQWFSRSDFHARKGENGAASPCAS